VRPAHQDFSFGIIQERLHAVNPSAALRCQGMLGSNPVFHVGHKRQFLFLSSFVFFLKVAWPLIAYHFIKFHETFHAGPTDRAKIRVRDSRSRPKHACSSKNSKNSVVCHQIPSSAEDFGFAQGDQDQTNEH